MEYNKQFVSDICAYIGSFFEQSSGLATALVSGIEKENDSLQQMANIVVDYSNIIKYMDFCNQNNNTLNLDINTNIAVIKNMQSTVEKVDYVEFHDVVIFEMLDKIETAYNILDNELQKM